MTVIAQAMPVRIAWMNLSRKDSKVSSILLEADKIVNGERKTDYGCVHQTFEMVAQAFNLYRGKNLTKQDVAWIMMLLKLVRESHSHKRDNLVDLSGYAELLNQLEEPKLPF